MRPRALRPDGEWHHVAMAVDRGASHAATLYVDGVSVASADFLKVIPPTGTTVIIR